MSVIVTKEDLVAYAEVDYIIKHMQEKYRKKLPENLLNFFETMKDPEFEVSINPFIPLQNQGLQQYTLQIIALLHVKYWCESQERKQQLLARMKENQEKFEAQLREQFNKNDLFGDKNEIEKNRIGQDPMVTAYSDYVKQNPDIQDYTDLREAREMIEETLPEKGQPSETFWEKIKKFLRKIGGKRKKLY